jgi:hypothetical protein
MERCPREQEKAEGLVLFVEWPISLKVGVGNSISDSYLPLVSDDKGLRGAGSGIRNRVEQDNSVLLER